MKKSVFVLGTALILLLAGCGREAASAGVIGGADGPTKIYVSDGSEPPAQEAAPEPAPEPEKAPEPAKVADPSQMAPAKEVVEEGMVPVTADELADGSYDVAVDSSSGMFQITACDLTVKDGEMTAVMHMGGTGYLRVFMGTGEEAAAASEADCIPFHEEADGTHTFTVPVEALDKGIDCAAFSKNKEIWYDRTLVFRADSLPTEAFAGAVTAESLGLADGEYTVEVSLAGGSGKAKVESPAAMRVSGGQAVARIVWGSKNYDYMRIGDEKYDPLTEADGVSPEDNAAFEIPVPLFDRAFTVYADTTAMSEPHEIEYTMTFDAASIK